MVDAALAGLDLGELVTIPSLPELSDWRVYERERRGSHRNYRSPMRPRATARLLELSERARRYQCL